MRHGLHPPEPPEIEVFGLTREQYDKAHKPLYDRIGGLVGTIIRGLVATIMLAVPLAGFGYVLYDSSDGFTDISFGSIAASLFFSIGPIFLLFAGLWVVMKVAGVISNLLWTLSSPTYRAMQRYDTAFEEYQRKKEEYDLLLRKRQEKYWRSLNGRAFEYELASLFESTGYSVETTPPTGDAGVDLILRKDDTMTIVQCKAHAKKVGIGTARELSACLRDFNADRAMIACLEGVTRPVTDYIKDKPIDVIDVHDIVEMQRGLHNGDSTT